LERGEIVAVHLHAELGADAGREHEDSVLDWLEKAGGVAGDGGEPLLEFGDELGLGHARPPLVGGLEHDGRLDHLDGGGIGGRVEPAEFAGDRGHLGHLPDGAVLPRQDAFDLGERHARHEHRHEE